MNDSILAKLVSYRSYQLRDLAGIREASAAWLSKQLPDRYFGEPKVDLPYRELRAMPQFDPELIQVMKKVLEDIMTRVPLEHSTPAAKAYFAECILKAAAQGQTSYDALIVAAADQIEVFVALFS